MQANLVPPFSKELHDEGVRRIEWAQTHMGVLNSIRARFRKEKPLAGLRVSMALHVEAKTCNLAIALQEAGADVRLVGCNPDSTDDRVVLAMNGKFKLPTVAKKGQNREEYYASLHWALDHKPNLVIDDGGDLGFLIHKERKECLEHILGGAEETTTGVKRFEAMAAEGALAFPVMNVNDALLKHLFDNRYGTGQSALDGIMFATNLVLAGKTMVVAGYGWCGRGIATRASGMGCNVIVTEIDPVRALEARMDGHRVMTMQNAIREADFVVTATGCADVVGEAHLKVAKSGVVLCNAGHFDNEISKKALNSLASTITTVRAGVERFDLKDRIVFLLSSGRLVNLASGQGHPVEIMDTSFAVQALSLEYLVKNRDSMTNTVHEFPAELDRQIAEIKLASLGTEIDSLSPEQIAYLSGWDHGT